MLIKKWLIHKLILFFVFWLLCSISQAGHVIRYVDPGAPGPTHDGTSWNNAYLSLGTWNTAEDCDLVAAGDYHTVYCRSSNGTANNPVNIGFSGIWNTGPSNYIEIIGADFPADGIYDGTKFRISLSSAVYNYALGIKLSYLYLINLQIIVTNSTASSLHGIYYEKPDVYIDSCIIKGSCTGTGNSYGIFCNNVSGTDYIYNTIISDFVSGSHGGFCGIVTQNTGYSVIYNCTVYNCYYGIYTSSTNTTSVINCVVGSNTDDFAVAAGKSFLTIDYCCSDDGDGTHAQGPTGGDWSNEFTTPGSDFSLKSGGNCIGNGIDNPGSGLYSDDIIGTTRSSPWDIGAFEGNVPPPPAAAGQVIMVEEF
jgi:parallel beta-helix repeat protein